MQRKGEKLYKAGDFAKISGISKDTLFFYDRIGLFKPMMRAQNGYRYYSLSQLSLLSTILSLRSMDVPISRILEYISGRDPDSFISLMNLERERIDGRIRELEMMRQSIDRLSALIEKARQEAGKPVAILPFPACSIVESGETMPDKATGNDDWWALYSSVSSRMHDIGIAGSRIAISDILSGEYARVMTVFIESNEPVGSEIPQGLYAVKYVKGPYSALDKAYRNLLKEIEAQGYRVVSDAFEEYVIDELATDDEEEYVSRIRIMVERR